MIKISTISKPIYLDTEATNIAKQISPAFENIIAIQFDESLYNPGTTMDLEYMTYWVMSDNDMQRLSVFEISDDYTSRLSANLFTYFANASICISDVQKELRDIRSQHARYSTSLNIINTIYFSFGILLVANDAIRDLSKSIEADQNFTVTQDFIDTNFRFIENSNQSNHQKLKTNPFINIFFKKMIAYEAENFIGSDHKTIDRLNSLAIMI